MMEQLYADFNAKLLPAIQDGLQVTQEYFIELFGRYVQYLIVTDVIIVGLNALIFGATIYAYIKLWKKTELVEWYDDDRMLARIIAGFIASIILLFTFLIGFHHTMQLAKAIYIPELRIYEELQQYRQ